MSDGALWTIDDIDDFDGACRLLESASCCIGVHDQLAQAIVEDVLKLLQRISGRSSVGVQFVVDPPTGMLH
jgi:hypothetical protein